MESETIFVDTNKAIDTIFEEEYWYQPVGWMRFIKSKDLGIQAHLYSKEGKTYLITDPKKWMLTRIKYGI
jgi:hypothetical protein